MSLGYRDIDAPAAGAPSGRGGQLMDSNKKIAGLVGDTLRKPTRSSKSTGELLGMRSTASGEMVRTMYTGDSEDCEVRARDPAANHMFGGIPKVGRYARQKGVIPGYSGHIAGKVAENIHGGTFHSENERSMKGLPVREMRRTLSAPDHLAAHQERHQIETKCLRVPSRVPGYAGQIPGKMSETVHGCTFAEANSSAQGLRNYNPVVSCEGWIHAAKWPCDRRATYKFAGKMSQADCMPHFTEQEQERALESNRRLGHTFGLRTQPHNPFKPGDRYMHAFDPPTKKAKRQNTNPDLMRSAGSATHDTKLDGQRWLAHNTLSLRNGNQRTAY